MPDQADSIDIEFVEIDGAGSILAQAYYPDDVNPEPIAGDVQFDIDEVWEIGNDLADAAYDLLYVAVHELGHALGLDHSDAVDSVMAESVSADQMFTSLGESDIDAILALYASADSGDDSGDPDSGDDDSDDDGTTFTPPTNDDDGNLDPRTRDHRSYRFRDPYQSRFPQGPGGRTPRQGYQPVGQNGNQFLENFSGTSGFQQIGNPVNAGLGRSISGFFRR